MCWAEMLLAFTRKEEWHGRKGANAPFLMQHLDFAWFDRFRLLAFTSRYALPEQRF